MTRCSRMALVAALSASAASFAPHASAQSVTLYGILDGYVAREKAGPRTNTTLGDGGNAATRLGVRGTEDLGGGLQAEFLLEMSAFVDTGAGTAAGAPLSFDRSSYVGLMGNWGRVRIGRQYTPQFWSLFFAEPFGLNAVFSPMLPVFGKDGQTNLVAYPSRLNNMLDYMSPTIGGFNAELAYAPGESADPSRRSGDGLSVSLNYRNGPVYLSYGATQMRGGTSAAPVANPSKSTHQSLSGSYSFGDLVLFANYMRVTTDAAATLGSKTTNVGVRYQVTPFVRFLGGYTRRDVNNSPRDANIMTLGLEYDLSKRTALYSRWLTVNNQANAANALGRLTVTANSGEDLRVVALGVRHSF